MVGDSPYYDGSGTASGSAAATTAEPSCEDDCDGTGSMSASSWREIFVVAACRRAGSTSPTLGVNYMRAAQKTTTVKYSLAAHHGGSSNKGSCSEYATLTLGQDLRKLGLGAVVWDCVSGTTIKPSSIYIRTTIPMSLAVFQ